MANYTWRTIKRFAVLIPGIIAAYISVREFFPFADKRLPLLLAIFLTYIVAAYALAPALLRLWRIIQPTKHLPFYCITPDGYSSDPLNIGLIGSRTQLIKTMEAAGWHIADPNSVCNSIFVIIAIILNKPYHGAPMSSLYLFGRRQDVGFEKQLNDSGRGHRHHVRFWATTFDSTQELSALSIHWRNRKEQLIADKLLWVGAASRDIGIAVARQSWQLTHAVDPDTNRERDMLVAELEEHKLAKLVATIRLNRPYQLINSAWSRTLETDGQMAILKLKG